MSKKEIKEDAMKNEDSKGFAFLGIFLTVIGFVIVLLTHKKDKYAMYYAKQGLIIFFGFLVAGAVSAILGWIPIVGWIVSTASWIFMMGLIYSLSGEEKEIWLVGELAKKINV